MYFVNENLNSIENEAEQCDGSVYMFNRQEGQYLVYF